MSVLRTNITNPMMEIKKATGWPLFFMVLNRLNIDLILDSVGSKI